MKKKEKQKVLLLIMIFIFIFLFLLKVLKFNFAELIVIASFLAVVKEFYSNFNFGGALLAKLSIIT